MRVELAYGTDGLTVELPDAATVVRPQHGAPVDDVGSCLRSALREPVSGPPLRDLLRPGARVAVSMCDRTRPQPRQPMLRALFAEFEGIVADRDVTVLVATGTHRGNTPDELRLMLGDLVDRVEVVNHDARDDASLAWCGVHGRGVPTWLNRRWVEADVRITTGFVEPHFFAGFSGGPKLVAPGLAGLETVLMLHDATRIGDSRATWGVCEGNPVHDDIRAIAAGTGATYALDVVLDARQRVTAAFGGELFAMHAAAREHVRSTAMAPVPARFDIVVTTNSGFPLDQNLYQAVKGMSAAATVVRPGGLIIAAAECRDGFPEHGEFRAELTGSRGPDALLARIAARAQTVPDQWQVQVLARVLQIARVGLYTTGLAPADVLAAHLIPVPDVAAFVARAVAAFPAAHGRAANVCVLPEGPQTIPYVSELARP